METVTQETNAKEVFVGIDVHLKTYAVTVISAGERLQKWTTPAAPERLAEQLRSRYPGRKIYSVYEAGFSGFVLHRILIASGIQNIVVHAAAVAVSSGDRVKTDKRDSEKLARHLAAGLLKEIRVPSIEQEHQRQVTRTREQFVKARVRVMNQIRRRLVYFGYLTEHQGVLRRTVISSWIGAHPESELRFCISSQLRHWEFLDTELLSLRKQLKAQSSSCSYEKIYQTVPGFGPISSRILANELGDMSQFKNEKALFRFVGLTPSEHSSGEKVRRGHISRQGNSTLRKILVESAWVAIRKDSSLRAFFSRLSVRSGARRAIVAVARKLIGRARAAFRNGGKYQELVAQTSIAA